MIRAATLFAPVGCGTVDRARVTEDLDRLDSWSIEEREAAERRLLEPGPSLIPSLERALAIETRPEVKARLHGIVRKLELVRTIAPKAHLRNGQLVILGRGALTWDVTEFLDSEGHAIAFLKDGEGHVRVSRAHDAAVVRGVLRAELPPVAVDGIRRSELYPTCYTTPNLQDLFVIPDYDPIFEIIPFRLELLPE